MLKDIASLGISLQPLAIFIIITMAAIIFWLLIMYFFRKILHSAVFVRSHRLLAKTEEKESFCQSGDSIFNSDSADLVSSTHESKCNSYVNEETLVVTKNVRDSYCFKCSFVDLVKLFLHVCIILFLVLLSFYLIIHANVFQNEIDNKQIRDAFTLEINLLAMVVEHYLATFSLCVFCLVLWYALSIMDFEFFCVPNILLVCFFVASCALYYLHVGWITLYPLAMLGIVYLFFFLIHCISAKQLMGEGDIWVCSSMIVLLSSFFEEEYSIVAQSLVVSSVLGILSTFVISILTKYKCRLISFNTRPLHIAEIKIPFVPFLFLGFILVSLFHVA
ncbi:A24 family peptidase [Helicobacter aurati]|nr:hypothetical protein [Helicobacter aurati]